MRNRFEIKDLPKKYQERVHSLDFESASNFDSDYTGLVCTVDLAEGWCDDNDYHCASLRTKKEVLDYLKYCRREN